MITLKEEITINPPPYSDPKGNVITPSPVTLNSINLIIIDNPNNNTISGQIQGFNFIIPLWSGNEYINKGDWTRSEAEQKLLEILDNDPATKLRSMFPKTLEEHPNHPGTLLSKMIKSMGFSMTDSCSCKRHALQMNEKGNDWCEQNIDTIVGWLREEAKKRNLPFIDAIGKLMVNRSIKKSRKLLANEPVPENDEDLDSTP